EGHLAGGAGDPDVLDYQSAGAHLLVESRACDRAQRRIRLHRYDVKPAMEVVGGVVAVVHTDVEYFLHQGPLRMHLRLTEGQSSAPGPHRLLVDLRSADFLRRECRLSATCCDIWSYDDSTTATHPRVR